MYYIMDSQHHNLVSMISYPDMGWGLHFTKGEYLPPNFGAGNILIEFESDHSALPDYFEIDGTPVVSEKFVQVWKTLPIDNYQLFPVTAKFPSFVLQGHHILNVVGREPCIDTEASDCNFYEGHIVRIQNLVLRSDINKALDLFRAEKHPLTIVISGRIKDLLQSSGLSGLLVMPADGWSDKHRF